MKEIHNTLTDAQEVNLAAPTGGILESVHVKVEIDPPTGSLLIYGAPTYDSPVKVEGPVSEIDIPTTEPKIYIQKIGGAEEFKLWTLGYKDSGI